MNRAALLSHYELNGITAGTNIEFKYIDKRVIKSVAEMVPTFIVPVIVEDVYRIIPTCCRYAISVSGEVYDTKRKTILPQYVFDDYPYVDIYNPDKKKITSARVHRLVGYAWVPNNDWLNNSVINHIDGNKLNPAADNVEWVSYRCNSLHAVEHGLVSGNIRCRLRNSRTGEIIELPSLSQVAELIGATRFGINNIPVRETQLVGDLYEIRLGDDDRDWIYLDSECGKLPTGRYKVTVNHDGKERVFYNVLDFKRAYRINAKSDSVHSLATSFLKMYPGAKIDILDQYGLEEIQAMDARTGNVITKPTISAMAEFLQISKVSIRDYLKRKSTHPLHGYAFRRFSNEHWDLTTLGTKVENQCVIASHPIHNDLVFNSIRKAAKHFRIDRKTVVAKAKSKKDFNGWSFKVIAVPSEDINQLTVSL